MGDQQLENHVAEITQVIEHMDFRWDNGFITDQEAYLAERVKLQEALEQLTPIPDDELQIAADIIENFEEHSISSVLFFYDSAANTDLILTVDCYTLSQASI
ncbi:MAG: hypothetical protein F9K46_00030 [Anaerolineae bacterium]|nr:MAG: hypothetical protein F9K46_00030 [Anaerolineae bacterium]